MDLAFIQLYIAGAFTWLLCLFKNKTMVVLKLTLNAEQQLKIVKTATSRYQLGSPYIKKENVIPRDLLKFMHITHYAKETIC